MEAESNYWLIWVIYLAAGIVFYLIFWWITRFRRALWSVYSLRAITAAIILTPWYANAQGTTLAPALIVLLLDIITIDNGAASRAAVPLVLSIIVAEVIATILFLLKRNSKKRIKTTS